MNNASILSYKRILNQMNLEKLEKIFFALFLLSIPIQTRLTFHTPQTYLNGNFNEYATFFLYLSDLLLIITLFIIFVNITTKHLILTKTTKFSIKLHILNLFHSYPRIIHVFILLVTLITWSFTSILWSEHKNIAFYQAFKILEFGLLFMYISYRLNWFGYNKFISLIFLTGFIQSIIGIAQYALQKSLGLKIFMESNLSSGIPNVAKIIVNGEKIIRAYGTFPHPNIFSGFLILSIFCGFWLLLFYKNLFIVKTSLVYDFITKLFHVKQFSNEASITPLDANNTKIIDSKHLNNQIVSRLPSEASFSKTTDDKQQAIQIVSRETICANAKEGETILFVIIALGLLVQLTALIYTFSRTAWLASIISVSVFMILTTKSRLHYRPAESFASTFETNVSRTDQAPLTNKLLLNNSAKLFHVKQFENIWKRLKKHIQNASRIPFEANNHIPSHNTKKYGQIVSRETIYTIILIVLPLVLIIGINLKQITNRTNITTSTYQESTDNRVLYNNIAISIIKDKPITGIGGKNFTLQMQAFMEKPLSWWQFQPTHNIYLLIASELGMFGFILFLLLLYFVLKTAYICNNNAKAITRTLNGNIKNNSMLGLSENSQIVSRLPAEANPVKSTDIINQANQIVSRETICAKAKEGKTIYTNNKEIQTILTKRMADEIFTPDSNKKKSTVLQIGTISILIGFLFIGLFDHYFWTLQQGQLIFWLVLGIISSFGSKK